LPSFYVGYIHSITLCFSVSYMVKCRYVGLIQFFLRKILFVPKMDSVASQKIGK